MEGYSPSRSDEIYELGEGIICYNVKELGLALVQNWAVGIEQLYEKNLIDRLKQYNIELATSINQLLIHRFPGNCDAGLMATAVTLNPQINGICWKGTRYTDISEIAIRIWENMPEQVNEMTDLLESGALSYYLEQTGKLEEATLVKEIEVIALQDSKSACARFVFRVIPEKGYHYADREFHSVDEYIEYLKEYESVLSTVLYETFSETYFIVWLQEQGYGELYNEWREYFYNSNLIRNNGELVGNVFQFLEKICESKKVVISQLMVNYLKKQPEYWIKEHLELYQMDEVMEDMMTESFDAIEYFPQLAITELLRIRARLKQSCQELRRDFMNNPYLYQMNIYDGSAYRITSAYADACFIMDADEEYVPVGWIKEQNQESNNEILTQRSSELLIAALAELDELQHQAIYWQRQMEQERQKKENEHTIPGKLAGIPGIILGIFVIIASIVVLIVDRNWNMAIVTDICAIVSIVMALLCLYKSSKQLHIRACWHRMKETLNNITEYIGKIQQMQVDLQSKQEHMEHAENNILYASEIDKPSINYATEIKVEHAIWGQYSNNLKVTKKTGLYFWILIIVFSISALVSAALNWKHLTSGASEPVKVEEETVKIETVETQTLVVKYRVNVARANVRTGPGVDYEVYDTYTEGTTLTATGNQESDGQRLWFEVTVDTGELVWICETTVDKVVY